MAERPAPADGGHSTAREAPPSAPPKPGRRPILPRPPPTPAWAPHRPALPRPAQPKVPPRRRPFDVTATPGFALVAVAGFVLLYAPIATLVAYSFSDADSAAVWGGFSPRWYQAARENEQVQDAAIRSVVIATAAIAATVATLVALGTTRRLRGRTLI